MGVLSAVQHTFNENAMQARTPASSCLAKAIRASHGPLVIFHSQAKEIVKRTKENPKDCPKEPRVRTKDPKVPKAHAKVKTSKMGISGLENLKSETCSETQESLHTSWIHEEWSPDDWNDGWSLDEWNDDRSCVGWHQDCEQTHDTSVSSFSLWVKMNLDTGAAVDTFLSNFGPEGIADGSFYDWIPDGEAWQFQGFDENGLPRSLSGRLTDAHEVLCSTASAPASGAAGIACIEQQDFYVRHNCGYMIPTHSKIGQEMRIHFEKLLNEYGKNELIPVYLENDTPNFHLNREVKSEKIQQRESDRTAFWERESTVGKRVWQSSALVSPMTTLNRDAVPIGDDIESVEECRVDIETGYEEEEEVHYWRRRNGSSTAKNCGWETSRGWA